MTRSDYTTDAATADPKPGEADLLEWLEGFAERLKGRTNAVADEVQQLVEAMDTVELNLQNTFNSFRCLSSSQFVENHVYEEDETDLVTPGMSKKDAKRPSMPTESYEDEILPRYKDAITFAWAAFQRSGRHDDQRTVQPGSRNAVRDPHQGERIQILPHIIGSEEFTRDVYCGLSDLRQWHRDPESDTELESVRAGSAAEPSATGILSEGDISGTDSDAFDTQEESAEPAVSAALDFKAMLEAALRTPSLPYDGSTSHDALFGVFTDNGLSLPNLTDDNLNNSPRTISTMVDIIGRTRSTMDESKEKLRDGPSQQSDAVLDSTQLPLATEPLQSLDDPTPSSTVEELLKTPSNSITQSMLNQEFRQYLDSNNGNRQVGTGDLGHLPIIPGALFNDEARDSGFIFKEDVVVPNSNTGPTIPEGLFEEQLSLDPKQHNRTKSQSSNLDASQIQPLPLSSLDVVRKSSSQDSESVVINSERKESGKLSASSLTTKHASSSLTGQLPIRGGLFDDEDEDDDAGDLFGTPAPRVDSHALLRPWASQSSKGLFDDIAKDGDKAPQSLDEAGSSQEGQRNSGVASSLASQYKGQPGHGTLDLLQLPVDSAVSQTYSGRTYVDPVTSGEFKETVLNSQIDVNDSRHLPVQPTEAAAVRTTVPVMLESDDDTWSSSESEIEEVVQGKTLSDLPIQLDASVEVPRNDASGANEFQSIIAGVLDLMPESITPDTENLSETISSSENISHGEGEGAVSHSLTAPDVSPAGFPPAISRSFSSTETAQVMVSVKPAENPLLQSTALDLSDAEASDSSDSTHSASSDLHGIRQLPIVQNIVTGTRPLPENLQPSTSQAPGFVSKPPSSSGQNVGHKFISEDLGKASSTSLLLPVKEVGRPATRTFTPLFDDDDDDDDDDDITKDLFGHWSPKHQAALYPGTGQVGIPLSSDVTLPISLGHGTMVDAGSPFSTQQAHNQPPPVSSLASDFQLPSQSASVESKIGERSSAKSGSNIASLLFGDDDDDEDALFGPLGGRTARSSKSGKGGSIFGD